MAGIVFGCVVPHPPLLVPDVGRGQEKTISATAEALQKLCARLSEQHPDTIVVVSPHGEYHSDAMGILTAQSSAGDMASWGARGPRLHFKNNLEMVALIKKEAGAASIPVQSIGDKGYELDHGVMVPMHFLSRGAGDASLVPVTFSWLPLETHLAFGRAIKRAAEQSRERVVLIASGDLSHRLIPEAPAGYDPLGKVFDEKLIQAMSRLDTDSILRLDAGLISRAGECGLRSCVILLGALEGLKVKPEILSYEGPFGVGYLVASFEVVR